MAAELEQIAAQQAGAFTVRQAYEAGMTRHEVGAACAGMWLRLGHNVVVRQALWDAMDDAARHRCRLSARLLVLRPGWMAARRTAAGLHGLPLLGGLPVVPQLLAAPQRVSDRASSRHERLATLAPGDTCRIDGLPSTSLSRTALDLLRAENFRSGVVVADAVLRSGLPYEQLASAAVRPRSWPGGAAAMRVVRFADGRSESPLESISRVAFHELGLPAPEPQVEVWLGDELLARVDFFWRHRKTVGEADGTAKYRSAEDLWAEKQREDRLRRAGFEVVRWSWKEAWQPRGVLDVRLQEAFSRAEGRVLEPRLRFVSTVPRIAAVAARSAVQTRAVLAVSDHLRRCLLERPAAATR